MIGPVPLPSIEIAAAPLKSFYNPYLNEKETGTLLTLIKSARPKVMIEIGCQLGRTAKILLENLPKLKTYVGIDVPFNHEPTLACQRREIPYSPGVYAAEDKRFFLLVHPGGSLNLGPQDLERCDAVFIDGDHSEQVVMHDSHLARALVRPGGIIVWHDFGNPAVEVTKALLWLHENEGWPIQSAKGTWLAFMRTWRQ